MENPNIRMCTGCNYIHPPPWDNLCPSKLAKSSETVNISKFISDLTTYLLNIKNSDEIINKLRQKIREIEMGR